MPVPAAISRLRARRTAHVPAGRRRAWFGIVVLGLLLALAAPLFRDTLAHGAPRPAAGEVSFAQWGALDAPVELAGQWRLTWLGAEGSDVARGATALAAVPGSWQGVALADGGRLPGRGVAAYALTVRDLRPGRYTLYVPQAYAADRVYLDGRLMGTSGVVGRSAATTRYRMRSHSVSFSSDGRPLRITIVMAAFLHRDSGPDDAPVLGLAEPMQTWTGLAWTKDLLFQTALMLLALNALVAYLFRRQDRASLFLALAATATIPGTSILSYDNLLLLALPNLPFAAMLALQYLCSTLAIGFFLTYARTLFPAETPRLLYRALIAMIALYFAAQAGAFLLGDTYTASKITLFWPIASGLSLLSTTLIVLRASLRGRDGATVFLLGIGVFTAFAIVSALTLAAFVPRDYLPGANSLALGMVMLLFSHVVVVAERWSVAIVTAEQINADLRQLIEVTSAITSEVKLDVLLARIVEVTTRILNADRSTLLIHDPQRDELWSLVAEGLTTREIRIPAALGLAGHAFSSGETLNVADAYADPRFNRMVDEATAYRTHSILTMPVITRDGRRLGVMQALNRRDERPFDDADITRMVAFAAQAAIAIDNATLFAEVVASRNYNESILRSMSSGVVTLDADAGIAKLNAAASRILNLPPEVLEGVNARVLLGETNPWLLAEIDAVAATGESKALIDVDLVTGGQRIVSTNLQIVPLIGDAGPAGLLVLIEDISEGKRLQGAMRRLVTQEIVDQVLARGDDLLFGTACRASVLFADIRDFTTMSEALSPRETVDMLNEAFTELFEAVAGYGGVLDKFIGDAIMAVYGAPLPTDRDPENAVESALQMLRALRPINARRGERGQPPLRLGIGITTGEVVAGTIGSPKRMDYTVIGDSVNFSARLQDLTKYYGVEVLVCAETAAAIADRCLVREIDLVTVRGRQRASRVFEVIATHGDRDGTALVAAYAAGRAAMAARDWAGAARAFERALAVHPGDRPSRLMLERTARLAEQPPDADWDGVWRLAAA